MLNKFLICLIAVQLSFGLSAQTVTEPFVAGPTTTVGPSTDTSTTPFVIGPYTSPSDTSSSTTDTLKQNQTTISSLLAKPGSPGTSVPVEGMNARLYYDANGVASKVILPDGTSATVEEFLNSKDYNDFVGQNSDNILSDSSGKSTLLPSLVPSNFNGEVTIAAEKNSNGEYDVLAGVSDTKGGAFDRAYNGISGAAPASPQLNDLDYNTKLIILTSQIWGITEVVDKMCHPLATAMPKSLSKWMLVVKNYVEAEKKRELLQQKRTETLKNFATTLTTQAGGNSSIQLEAIKMQIESLNIGIDSLSGSSLYSGDLKAGDARATSRLAWREALLVAAFQGVADCKAEDIKTVKAYNTCTAGIDSSLKVAQKACDRKKSIDCDDEKNKSSKDCDGKTGKIEVSDPVPGSCQMVKGYLPELLNAPIKDLAKLYFIPNIPSKQVNERYLQILTSMKKNINDTYPKSNDSNFDWSKPLEVCVDPLIKPVKDNGVVCPANASEKDYDKTKFENIGNAPKPAEGEKAPAPLTSKVAMPAEVTGSAKLFLSAMGMSESSLDDAAGLFSAYWNITDLYIGQSNIRQTYFQYQAKLITELVLADRSKLAQMLIDRQKMVDYYAQLKKLFDTKSAVAQTDSKGPGAGTTPTGSNAKPVATVAVDSTNLKPLDNLSNLTSSFSINPTNLDPASISALAKGSNGLLTFSPTAATGTLNSSNGSQMYSVAQNRKLNDIQNNSKKLVSTLRDLNAKPKALKPFDETKALLNADKITSNAMNPGFMGSSGLQLTKSLGGIPMQGSDSLPGRFGRNDSNSALANAPQGSVTSVPNKSNDSVSTKSKTPFDDKNKKEEEDESKASTVSSNPFGSPSFMANYSLLSDDEKKLYDAIYARNKESKGKYEKKESDSIFEQLTKAHIRNFERVKK